MSRRNSPPTAGEASLLALALALGGCQAEPPAASPPRPAPAPAPAPATEASRAPARPKTAAEIVAKVEPSVALVRGGGKVGTGFVAAPGLIATNAHVVEGVPADQLEVRFPSAPEGRRGPFKAEVVARERRRDLAFLKAATDLPPLEIAESYPFVKGDDVLVIGNPGMGDDLVLENAVSRGLMSTKAQIDGQDYYQMSIAINPGNSGGPVLDGEGKVVGVATRKAGRLESTAFCVPVEALKVALAAATSPGGSAEDAPATAALRYGWKPGETYVYGVRVDYDAGDERIALEGSSIYRVKAADPQAGEATLAHRGWLVRRRGPKDPKRGGDVQVQAPGGPTNVEFQIDDAGDVDDEFKGGLPVPLLGDLALLPIAPLPEPGEDRWTDERPVALQITKVTPGARPSFDLERPSLFERRAASRLRPGRSPRSGRFGGLRRAAPAPAPAQVEVDTQSAKETIRYARESAGGRETIAKDYEFATDETAGAGPRLAITGHGTYTFDPAAGVATGFEFRGEAVQNSENTTARLPIRVECRLLSGAERERALRFPAVAPTAMIAMADGDVAKALADLKSEAADRRRAAAEALRDGAPIESKRGEVAQALLARLDDPDASARQAAVQATGVWGGPEAFSAILAKVDSPDYGLENDLFETLARLGPEGADAAPLVAMLNDERRRSQAVRVLRAWGEGAEPALSAFVESAAAPEARIEACRVLKDVGTEKSAPMLERLAAAQDVAEVADLASNAIRAIEARSPSDADLTALLERLAGGDAGGRREAAGRLAQAVPAEARRAEVAVALADRLDDEDVFARGDVARGLRTWSDPAGVAKVVEKLKDPKYRAWREAAEYLAWVGPAAGAGAAEALKAHLGDDRGLMLRAMKAIGPASESTLLDIAGPDGPADARNDALRTLGEIGGEKSLPLLRKAAADRNEAFVAMSAEGALREIEARSASPAARAEALGMLSASDPGRRREALERLGKLQLDGEARDSVATAAAPLLHDPDGGVGDAARNTLRLLGGPVAARALADLARDRRNEKWRDAAQALVETAPTAAAAEPVLTRLEDDPGLCRGLLERIGPAAAGPAVLKTFREAQDSRKRIESCRLLESVGGPDALASLREAAENRKAGDLARAAEEALRDIRQRP